MTQRLAVAMSGGVDSSVAAYLLGQQGHELVGVTLRLHDCTGPEEAQQAARVAAQLGFDHHTIDMTDTFRRVVMDDFILAYEQGCTPNPCLQCNRHIKFGAMVDAARELDCEGVATGHYARICRDSATGRWLLRTALHPEKDQSYVLYMLTQQQLAASRFPLGELSKDEIRVIAAQQGLINAHKADSQDICFVPDGDYPGFIRRATGKDYPAGDFIDPAGRVLGRHEGIIAYTLGQRRGLGVSSADGRLYVTRIDPEANTVTLGSNEALFARTLEADTINFIPFDRLDKPLRVQAKARYRQQAQEAVVEQIGEDRIRVTFDHPQRAMTPGQAVVLYHGDLVVGGGTIRTVTE